MSTDLSEIWDLENLARARRLGDWMYSQFADLVHGRVAEVGAGIGTFSERLLASGIDDLLLIEPDTSCAAQLQTRFAGRAGVAVAGDPVPGCAELQARAGTVDFLLCQNVLEHVEDQRGALAEMAASLAPGGSLGLLVPAHPRLYGSLDRRFGHLRRYRRRDLAALIGEAGLVVERIHPFNALGVLGWLAKSTRRRPSLDPASLRAYELLLPLYRWVERIHPPPFGLSYVVRARREARAPARSAPPAEEPAASPRGA
jgi:SAM-dependent methyltransferase